jgi:hypothetical protein
VQQEAAMPEEKSGYSIPVEEYKEILDDRFQTKIRAKIWARILAVLGLIGAPSALWAWNQITAMPDSIANKVLTAVEMKLPALIDPQVHKELGRQAGDSAAVRKIAEETATLAAQKAVERELKDAQSALSVAMQGQLTDTLGRNWRAIELKFHEARLDGPHDQASDPRGDGKVFSFQRMLQLDPDRAAERLSTFLKEQRFEGARPEPFLDGALAALTAHATTNYAEARGWRIESGVWRRIAEDSIVAAEQRGPSALVKPGTVLSFLVVTAGRDEVDWLRVTGPGMIAGRSTGSLVAYLLAIPRAEARAAALGIAGSSPEAYRAMLDALRGCL